MKKKSLILRDAPSDAFCKQTELERIRTIWAKTIEDGWDSEEDNVWDTI